MNQPSQISPTISQLTTTFPQSQIRPPNNTIQYPKPSLIPLHPWNPQQEETNSRVFPRSIITQSVHSTKTSTSPSQRHGGLRGMRFTGGGGGPLALMVNALAIIKLFLAATRKAPKASVVEGMEAEEADPTGYKCRRGVSLDRGRLRRFNHDPSYTDRPHTARIPNRPFVYGIRASRRLWSWHEFSSEFTFLRFYAPYVPVTRPRV